MLLEEQAPKSMTEVKGVIILYRLFASLLIDFKLFLPCLL